MWIRPIGDVVVKLRDRKEIFDNVMLRGLMRQITIEPRELPLPSPLKAVRIEYPSYEYTWFYRVIDDKGRKIFCDEEGKKFLELH